MVVRRARIRVITVAIGAAAALLAGCGGTASSNTLEVVTSSATSAEPGEPIGETVDAVTLDRQVRQAMRDAGTCEITITGDGIAAHGQMRLDSGGMALSMELELSGGVTAVRLLPGAAYVHVPESAPGKHWLQVRPDGTDPLSRQAGVMLRLLRNLSDPVAIGGPPGVRPTTLTVVRHEDVDGLATSVYAAETVLTPAQAAANNGLAGTTVRFEAFIDAGHLPRRIVLEVHGPDGTQLTQNVGYADWGIPVTVTAPPESEVTDLTRSTN